MIANGIEPFVNLFHFDMPMELQKNGGWVNRETVDAYENYAKTSFRLFGDRVKKWFTHNEPIVPVEGGYLYDFIIQTRSILKRPSRSDFTQCYQVPEPFRLTGR
ncbi:mannoside-phospho-beta-d-glucosidase [Bacillus spizizenii]|nr:mannoside-phospho-beta-d-glucosidase [Bacillus spizizenii]